MPQRGNHRATRLATLALLIGGLSVFTSGIAAANNWPSGGGVAPAKDWPTGGGVTPLGTDWGVAPAGDWPTSGGVIVAGAANDAKGEF